MELPAWNDLTYPQRFFFSIGVACASEDKGEDALVGRAERLYEEMRAKVDEEVARTQ